MYFLFPILTNFNCLLMGYNRKMVNILVAMKYFWDELHLPSTILQNQLKNHAATSKKIFDLYF